MFVAGLALVVGCAGPGPTSTPSAQDGWRRLADFPTQGAASLPSVIAVDDGFVAIGSVVDPEAECVHDAYQARVWTSADGMTWVAQGAGALAQTRPVQLFEFGDALYAVGVTGSGDDATSCATAPDQPGVNFWRSADGGVSWQRLAQSPAMARGWVSEVVVAEDRVLAVGATLGGDTEIDRAAAWESTDIQTWTPAELPPDAPALVNAAARDNVVVGFGVDEEFPLAWISRDFGRNWYEESIDVEGADPEEGLTMAVEGVVAAGDGYVGVGSGCCLGVGQLVPIVVNSADGTQWQGRPQLSDYPEAMSRIVAIPSGLLAVGVETYPVDEPDQGRLGGRSWLSADGKDWRRGPDFAELGDGTVTAIAAGTGGVVVAGSTNVDSLPSPAAGETGLRVWFAPYGAFAVSSSN